MALFTAHPKPQPRAALRLYTSAAARYTFEEGRKGTLEPGKLADLAVLPADH